MPESGAAGWSWTRAGYRWMLTGDILQARRRIRYAWVAAFVWAGISLFNAGINAVEILLGTSGLEQPVWSAGQLAFVLAESTLMAALGLGVLLRRRPAAALLFGYFCVSRFVLLGLGVIPLQQAPDLVRLLVQVLVAYLFLQGVRGTLAYHYLTHPYYPEARPPGEAPAGLE